MRRPLIWCLIAFVMGIMTGSYFSLPYNLLLTLAALVLIFIWISIRNHWLTTGFFLVAGFLFLLGFFNIQKQFYFLNDDPDIINYINQGKITVEGIVAESPVSYPDKNILMVHCLRVIQDKARLPLSGNIRLAIPADLNFRFGDFIRFHSSLRKIENFNNPGCFNYKRLMNLQGIYVSGFIHDHSGIILLRKNTQGGIRQKVESFRIYLKQVIQKNAASPQKDIIEAMTLGNQNEIPDEIRDNFSKTGTSHILSISGLHVGMVGATFFLMFFLILKSSEYLMLRFNIIKIAAAISFLIVLIYAFIAGMGVTVMRSAMMAFIFLLALLSGKQKDLYNTLTLAGLIILLISPEALFDISFQLSFVSVLAIIYVVPRLNNFFPKNMSPLPGWAQSVARYLFITVTVCIAATIGTLPLIIFYFDRVSIVTIIANLIVVPLLGTLTLALAMFFILSALFSPVIAGYFVQLASRSTQLSITIINTLATLPGSSLSMTKPVFIEIAFFYLFIFCIFQFFAERKKKVAKDKFSPWRFVTLKYFLIITVLFFVADIMYLSLRDRLSPDLRITIIDVGQGNSTLVQFPGGENMLIDGGGFVNSSFDIGKGVVAQFLYKKRINKIETAVLSHPHPDHLSGLIYILNNFNVRDVWQNHVPVEPDIFPEWEKAIGLNHININHVSDHLPEKIIHGVKVKILWPPDHSLQNISTLSFDQANDSSLVLKITLGKTSILIPGDISAETEKKLIHSGADLKSAVLLVPHHGSNHSSSAEFIKAVSCRLAVVSAGKYNVFGHPHPSVLQRYKEAGADMLRTDQNGAITITTDGNRLLVDTFIKNN